MRKHTRDAMRRKAEAGHVTGGTVFGYNNVRIAKGHVAREINEAEAAIVREIYSRFANGEGARAIALALNRKRVPSPRAQQGRPSGWSASTIRAVLERPLYRGEGSYGRSTKAYGRELRKVHRDTTREKGQVPQDEQHWTRFEAPAIIDRDLAQRVDALRQDRRRRYLTALTQGGRVPERAHGKYLLSGGMLVCPTCGGHFEARKWPWKGNPGDIYICATRRRKPGVCSNTLALPIAETDDAVLSEIEGEVLGPRLIDELLSLVDTSPDPSIHLTAERDRLKQEHQSLINAIVKGVKVETVKSEIEWREVEIARLERELRKPRPERPDIEKLRAALEQRAEAWKADLRSEPHVARLVLRRLIGPLTLWDEATRPAWCRWEALTRPAGMLDGLVSNLVTSPTGVAPFLRGSVERRAA